MLKLKEDRMEAFFRRAAGDSHLAILRRIQELERTGLEDSWGEQQ